MMSIKSQLPAIAALVVLSGMIGGPVIAQMQAGDVQEQIKQPMLRDDPLLNAPPRADTGGIKFHPSGVPSRSLYGRLEEVEPTNRALLAMMVIFNLIACAVWALCVAYFMRRHPGQLRRI